MSMLKKYLKILKFEKYKKDKERINRENRRGITLILVFYSVILILNLLSTLITRQNMLHNGNLMLELIFMVVTVPLYFFILIKKNINFTRLIYVLEIPMLLIPIWHGTFGDPEGLTFTFLLFLLILPELILDKPWHVIIFIVVMTAVYVAADAFAKVPEVFVRDLLHAINTCLMSIATSLYVLYVRIQNNMYINMVEDKADRDPLTGLYNRFGAERYFPRREPGILLYMDLDRFKEVNDSLGHGEGDRVLQKTAEILRSCFREHDILIRMGGDEFAVFAPGQWTEDKITEKLAEVLKDIHSIHSKGGYGKVDIGMTVSIGCVYAPAGADEIDELIRYADRKMYEVKRNGKDSFEAGVFEE